MATVTLAAAAARPASPFRFSENLSGSRSSSKLVLMPSEKLSVISYKGLTCVICDCPTDRNLGSYILEFQRLNVQHLVRLCEAPYPSETLTANGITVHDMHFRDGEAPPNEIIKRWLALVDECMSLPEQDRPAIAVHCVAGLGRAPVLVAIALVESGMSPLDAVEFIRKRRPGAFNTKQICFIDGYKRRNKTVHSFKNSISRLFGGA